MTSLTAFLNADTIVQSSSPTTNFGILGTFNAGNAGSNILRALLNFDLSSLPFGAIVSSAILSLQASNNSSTVTFAVQRVTSSWTETGVTWNTQPTTGASEVTFAGVATDATQTIDVTSIVQGWQTSGDRFGLRITESNEATVGSGGFYSREANATLVTLTITYTVASPPSVRRVGTAVMRASTR